MARGAAAGPFPPPFSSSPAITATADDDNGVALLGVEDPAPAARRLLAPAPAAAVEVAVVRVASAMWGEGALKTEVPVAVMGV